MPERTDHGASHDAPHAHPGHDDPPPAGGPAAPRALTEARDAQEQLGAAATHGHPDLAHAEHAEHAGQGHAAAEPAGAAHAGHAAHSAHAGHSEATFARPFWVCLLLTLPVLVYAEHLQRLLGYTAPAFPGSAWLEPVLGSVIYWYGGWAFLTGAVGELRARRPGMMTLVALAITTAYLYSLAVTVGLVAGAPFYWELATLVTIMLLGHWLELRAVGSAQSALSELAKLLPDTAEPGKAGAVYPRSLWRCSA